jgi:hypothetical protein
MADISCQGKTEQKIRIYKYYLIILFAAGLLYVVSCAPAILWQDSSLFVYRIWHNDIQGDLGIALSHPLYILAGMAVKCIPLGDFAYRINLISAVAGAFAVANLFLVVYLWLGRFLPAVISAISLAVSWTFWQHAAIAEVYTLCAAQMFAELIMLLLYIRTKRIRYLYLLGFLNGLTIANHLWGIFGFLCYLIYSVVLLKRKEITVKSFWIIALLWITGAIPYEYLVIKDIIVTGDITGTISSALFGTLWQGHVLNTSITSKIVIENIIFIVLNFPTLNFALFFLGLWIIRKASPSRAFSNILTALLLLHLAFAFRYVVVDRYAFFLPFYCFAAIFIGVGADAVLQKHNSKIVIYLLLFFSVLPAVVYCTTPSLARKYYKPLGQRRQRPYRDEYVYFLQPWKTGYRGAERFASEALEILEENALIYADPTSVCVLLCEQEVRNKRKDVKILSDYFRSEGAPVFTQETIETLMENHAVYVTSIEKGYCPSYLSDHYEFERVANKGGKVIVWKMLKDS